MPAGMKRTALTQEVVRICRNTRQGLPWEKTAEKLSDFSQRLRASGYNEDYRLQVMQSGVKGYDKMVEVAGSGGRPINRPKTWEEDKRQKKKDHQKTNWYKSGGYDVPLFVPHTPRGELAQQMRAKEAENNQGRKIRFKIIEKGGGNFGTKTEKI